MNIFKIDKNNISLIKDLYNEFKKQALSEYGFEFEPLEFEEFKNTILKGMNKGFVSIKNQSASGFLLYSDNISEAIELTLLIGKNENIKRELIKNFLEYINSHCKNKLISYPLLGKQAENATLLTEFKFEFVKESILEVTNFYSYMPALPENYKLSNWEEDFLTSAAKTVHETFSRLNDTKFDPRFLTFIGCKSVINLITKNILGEFLGDITTVLLYKNEPVGFCFVNLSNNKTANIPILSLSNKHHGKKLGEILVKNSISKLSNKNLPLNKINVTCESDNISAMKTYINSGFIKSDEYKHFYLNI